MYLVRGKRSGVLSDDFWGRGRGVFLPERYICACFFGGVGVLLLRGYFFRGNFQAALGIVGRTTVCGFTWHVPVSDDAELFCGTGGQLFDCDRYYGGFYLCYQSLADRELFDGSAVCLDPPGWGRYRDGVLSGCRGRDLLDNCRGAEDEEV